ncbi:MAG: hypothetical protein ACYDAK_05275 [Candidatus Limnocylindrales bacterium]
MTDQDPHAEAPGLREQLRATVAAGVALVRAHLELARAEIAEIAVEIQRVALLAGAAVAALLFLGVLLPVGLILFLGEWLFGSIGWGLLLGSELCLAIAVTALVLGLGLPARRVGSAFGWAVATGVVLAIVLGAALTNTAWTQLGMSVAPGVESGVRPLVVGTAALAAVGAVLGLILGARSGGRAALGGIVGGAIGGAIVGAIVGALSAVRFGAGPGVALGVAVGLATWSTLLGMGLGRTGVDTDALKARFWPSQTIETTKETIEWVRERTPLGPPR